MAEWSKAPDSKSGLGQPNGGSNPSLSANSTRVPKTSASIRRRIAGIDARAHRAPDVIILVCMLEPCRIDWLPQLVAHYRGLGVERFLFSLQLEPDAAPPEKERHRATFEQTLAALD